MGLENGTWEFNVSHLLRHFLCSLLLTCDALLQGNGSGLSAHQWKPVSRSANLALSIR